MRSLVIRELQLAGIQRIQDILRPRDEEPHDRAVLVVDGLQDHFGLCAEQKDRLASGDQAAEPVHLRTCVVQRRNAEEGIVVLLAVMLLLRDCRVHETRVLVQDRLRETSRSRGKVYCRIIIICDLDTWRVAGVVRDLRREILRKRRAGGAIKQKQPAAADALRDFFDTPDEFRPEDQDFRIGQIQAVLDLIGRIPEVHRHRERAALQNAEVDRQPVEAVHQKDRDLVALAHAARE